MIKILITGKNSYIGEKFKEWMKVYSPEILVDSISVRDENWKNNDFSKYNVVLHLAGIAHVSSNKSMKDVYYFVNRDLTFEIAMKAKDEGVTQFIFMSSVIVYGNNTGNSGCITRETIPMPNDFYGDSKLQAEKSIATLANDNFRIAIIRPPMVYGKNSKGNYPKLVKAAKILPLFPDVNNKRSMLHIDNLCEFIRLIIKNEEKGLFFPQNKEYVKTSEMVKLIAEVHNKNLKLTKLITPFIKISIKKVGIINKIFGNLFYEKHMSEYKNEYRNKNLKESIIVTESKN